MHSEAAYSGVLGMLLRKVGLDKRRRTHAECTSTKVIINLCIKVLDYMEYWTCLCRPPHGHTSHGYEFRRGI